MSCRKSFAVKFVSALISLHSTNFRHFMFEVKSDSDCEAKDDVRSLNSKMMQMTMLSFVFVVFNVR